MAALTMITMTTGAMITWTIMTTKVVGKAVVVVMVVGREVEVQWMVIMDREMETAALSLVMTLGKTHTILSHHMNKRRSGRVLIMCLQSRPDRHQIRRDRPVVHWLLYQ